MCTYEQKGMYRDVPRGVKVSQFITWKVRAVPLHMLEFNKGMNIINLFLVPMSNDIINLHFDSQICILLYFYNFLMNLLN
jgi:hypothetical protein